MKKACQVEFGSRKKDEALDNPAPLEPIAGEPLPVPPEKAVDSSTYIKGIGVSKIVLIGIVIVLGIGGIVFWVFGHIAPAESIVAFNKLLGQEINLNNITNQPGAGSQAGQPPNDSQLSPVTQSADTGVQEKGSAESGQNTDMYNSQIAIIESKGFTPYGSPGQPLNEPDAQVGDGFDNTLYAWDAGPPGGDCSIHQVFFFIGNKYLGTDTLEPHGPIKSITAGDIGSIIVTYSVYQKNDPTSSPTGTPFVITYHWDGQKLAASAPFLNQFPADDNS